VNASRLLSFAVFCPFPQTAHTDLQKERNFVMLEPSCKMLQGSAHEDFLKETHAEVHDSGDWQL